MAWGRSNPISGPSIKSGRSWQSRSHQELDSFSYQIVKRRCCILPFNLLKGIILRNSLGLADPILDILLLVLPLPEPFSQLHVPLLSCLGSAKDLVDPQGEAVHAGSGGGVSVRTRGEKKRIFALDLEYRSVYQYPASGPGTPPCSQSS